MRIFRKTSAALLAAAIIILHLPTVSAANPLRTSGPFLTAAETAPDFTSFGDLLSPTAKIIYDALVQSADSTRDGKTKITFTFPSSVGQGDLSDQVFQDAINAFNRDHSEVFWIDFSDMLLIVTDYGGYLEGSMSPSVSTYYTSAYSSKEDVDRDVALMNSRIQEISKAASRYATTYERLLYIHDWLVMQNSYNTSPEGSLHMRTFEAVSALEGNRTGDYRPVCEGYARAFKLLCDKLNIPCILVTGEGHSGGNTAMHMWNYVKIGAVWYAVDATWDDATNLDAQGKIGYTYFLVGSETICSEGKTFSQGHQAWDRLSDNSSVIRYPALSPNAYSADADQAVEGMKRFVETAAYKNGIFSDVSSGAWYENGVASAYSYGLMKGTGNGKFGITGRVTLAEAIIMAARIHAIYYGNAEPVASNSSWYDAYVSYAAANHITSGTYEDYLKPATRAEFAAIFAAVLPEKELPAVNDVADGSVSDIPKTADYAAAAYLLYRAGVLIGNENGDFKPDANITRAEVAVIVTRMIVPENRVTL